MQLTYRIHDLRHTYATLLLQADALIAYVSQPPPRQRAGRDPGMAAVSAPRRGGDRRWPSWRRCRRRASQRRRAGTSAPSPTTGWRRGGLTRSRRVGRRAAGEKLIDPVARLRSCRLLVPQCGDRIDPRCAPRGNPACDERDQRKPARDHEIGHGVDRLHAEQQPLNESTGSGGRDQPATSPMSESTDACATTAPTTCPGAAPSASRMPISRVRWLTVCESTP